MTEGDNRHISRDSLFILAEMRVGDERHEYRVKVRNLSAGGMMGEGAVPVARGDRTAIHLRNVGWVDGTVAWVQASRFGVSFERDVDVKLVREPATRSTDDDPFRRKLMAAAAPLPAGPLRKVF